MWPTKTNLLHQVKDLESQDIETVDTALDWPIMTELRLPHLHMFCAIYSVPIHGL